ncbi:hypothetical protein PHMEG_0006793 [Phytophthora megakarya]|uniref:Uncharacterized protein n=1 Tax=Phytophthora megakarya TaxID=4795 RepID=A0A225WN14_9STRA|nr:hypothetical protein PHMEG_0006793 [Phytophthora megakarya]
MPLSAVIRPDTYWPIDIFYARPLFLTSRVYFGRRRRACGLLFYASIPPQARVSLHDIETVSNYLQEKYLSTVDLSLFDGQVGALTDDELAILKPFKRSTGAAEILK